MTEEWRAVPGYEGRYEVSAFGQVRSMGLHVGAKGGGTAFRKGRVLSQATKTNGYKQVTLVAADGARWSAHVHQIVCLAFLGPPPSEDTQIRHADGTRDNNDLSNLNYGDALSNAADRRQHGNDFFGPGEAHARAKLTEDDVRQIRKLAPFGDFAGIGLAFGVSGSHACTIAHRKAWKHI